METNFSANLGAFTFVKMLINVHCPFLKNKEIHDQKCANDWKGELEVYKLLFRVYEKSG